MTGNSHITNEKTRNNVVVSFLFARRVVVVGFSTLLAVEWNWCFRAGIAGFQRIRRIRDIAELVAAITFFFFCRSVEICARAMY